MEALMETEPTTHEESIASIQTRLLGFIRAMQVSKPDAQDILQETNRVLWRKQGDFEIGTNFWAWASKVAFFQVMAFRKRSSRDRHVFGDELVHLMSDEMAARPAPPQADHQRLTECLKRLPDRQREAIQGIYFNDEGHTSVAESMDLNENAVSQLVFRARQNLRQCLSR